MTCLRATYVGYMHCSSVEFKGMHLSLVTNAFCAGDEHYSAENEGVENMRSNFRVSHTHKASYQRQPNRTYAVMAASQSYSSPPKTGAALCGDPSLSVLFHGLLKILHPALMLIINLNISVYEGRTYEY